MKVDPSSPLADRRSNADAEPDLEPSASVRAVIRRKLLNWYDRNRRDLPWRRRTGDGYAQWIAEVMLQQTRVETVARYYEPFLRRFPTLVDFARAKRDSVLKAWEGLGYYRRAVHLHDAARQLVDSNLDLGRTADELRSLPGIGEYTAAAISSIAFGEPVAAVDGNACRVIARLFGIHEDILARRGRSKVDRLATLLVSRRRPGDFNQAWMDLGSLVCTPRVPECGRCPVRGHCQAHALGMTSSWPARGSGSRSAVPEMDLVVGWFRRGDRFMVRCRPAIGIWGGLWELPTLAVSSGETPRGALNRLMREMGLKPIGAPCSRGTHEHRLTHRRLRLHAFSCRVASTAGPVSPGSSRWVNARQFKSLSVPTALRRLWNTLNADPTNAVA